MIRESIEPTPYATYCYDCGLVCMTKEWYREQMSRPDSKWVCARCGQTAEWDDETYEDWLEEQETVNGGAL